MIWSIFVWLRAKPSLLCQAWSIRTPAVAWQGSRKSFSLLSLPVKQSALLSLLHTQLESQPLNSQSTVHMEGFHLRGQRYGVNFYCILCFSLVLSFFSQTRHSLLLTEQLLSAFQSPFRKSALHQLRNKIYKRCHRQYGSASWSADNQRSEVSFVWIKQRKKGLQQLEEGRWWRKFRIMTIEVGEMD